MSFAQSLVVFGLCSFAALATAPGDALAQQIYRSVGPDGRTIFSDTPPAGTGTSGKTAVTTPASGGTDVAGLPFELRQVVSRYPVTLYSGPDCGPCVSGRAMLAARGIPFTERTVSTVEDIEALKRLAAVATLPVLTIGSEQLKGFSDVEWGQFLDAAGYPRSSQLPAGFQLAPATPLVAVHEVKPPARSASGQRPGSSTAAETTPPLQPYNGGIRF